MPLTPGEVRRVATLARLELTEGEAERLAAQLAGVLDRVDRLEEPTEVDRPPAPAVGLRPDLPGPDPLDRPVADLAPDWKDGFFTVPRLPSHQAAGEREEEAP